MIDRDEDGRTTGINNTIRFIMTITFNTASLTALLTGHTQEAIALALLSIAWRKP